DLNGQNLHRPGNVRSFKFSRKWVDILGLQNAKLKRQINEVYREPRFKSLPSQALSANSILPFRPCCMDFLPMNRAIYLFIY
uniref:Uncharacterized protein n=1 Tax=Pseudonaja textilis TaxID=8673 RepID=A0A670ZUC4_PSETE